MRREFHLAMERNEEAVSIGEGGMRARKASRLEWIAGNSGRLSGSTSRHSASTRAIRLKPRASEPRRPVRNRVRAHAAAAVAIGLHCEAPCEGTRCIATGHHEEAMHAADRRGSFGDRPVGYSA